MAGLLLLQQILKEGALPSDDSLRDSILAEAILVGWAVLAPERRGKGGGELVHVVVKGQCVLVGEAGGVGRADVHTVWPQLAPRRQGTPDALVGCMRLNPRPSTLGP
jgi:hypothetical protein